MDKSTNQLGVIAENYNELKDLLDLALDFIKIMVQDQTEWL